MASELCRRGLYAQLTLGNYKRTDLIVESEGKFIRIQVKSKQGGEWPSISGPCDKDYFIVLVDLAIEQNTRPDFYIIDLNGWKQLLKKALERHPKAIIDEKLNIKYPDGWKGLNIKPAMVSKYKERWQYIINRCKNQYINPD